LSRLSGKVAYIALIDFGELVLRIGSYYRFFKLVQTHGPAFTGGGFTVIAEIIQPTARPVRNRAKLSQNKVSFLDLWHIFTPLAPLS
jgi:hypothetical protein